MNIRHSLGTASWMVIAASVAFAPSVLASSFERKNNVSVTERPKPEYQVSGIDLGGFILSPKFNIGLRYDDNIFAAQPINEVDDVILKLNPSAVIQSKWSIHSLALYADVDHNEYFDQGGESFTDFSIGSDGRIDVGQGLAIGLGAKYQVINEPRSSSSSPTNTIAPVQYDLSTFYANISQEVNRVRFSASVNLRDFDFDDALLVGGGIFDQDDRDRDVVDITARAGYAVSPDTSVFVEVGFNDRTYDLQPPTVPLNRDSDGYQILVGTNFDIGNLARGEIAIGYLEQSFADPTLSDIDGFAIRGSVEWFVSQLTTVGFGGSRSVEDSGIQNSSGFLASTAYAKVDHELLRNLIISAELTYGFDDFEGVDREDERFGGTLSSTVLLRRGVSLSMYYLYADQTSRGLNSGTDYTNNQIGFNVSFQR